MCVTFVSESWLVEKTWVGRSSGIFTFVFAIMWYLLCLKHLLVYWKFDVALDI